MRIVAVVTKFPEKVRKKKHLQIWKKEANHAQKMFIHIQCSEE